MTAKREHAPRRYLAALTVAAAFGLSGCGDDGGNDDNASNPAAEQGETARGKQEASNFTIKLIAFKPTEVRVAPGTTVTWNHDDVATHTVTSGSVEQSGGTATAKPDGKYDSGNLTKGQTFEFTFPEPGAYPFFCAVHPATMTGVVHVG